MKLLRYNVHANVVKQRVKNLDIDFKEACEEIEKMTTMCIIETGERPPALLPNHYEIDQKVSKFTPRVNSLTTLEELGNLLWFLIEKEDQQKEKEAAKKRPRVEWVPIELMRKPHSNISYERVVRELKRYVDLGLVNKKKGDQIKRDFKECEFYRCNNAFYVGPGGFSRKLKYCSMKCYWNSRHSRERLEGNGTHLKQSEYITPLSETVDHEYFKNRTLVDFDEILNTGKEEFHESLHEMRVKELIKLNKKQPVKVYHIN